MLYYIVLIYLGIGVVWSSIFLWCVHRFCACAEKYRQNEEIRKQFGKENLEKMFKFASHLSIKHLLLLTFLWPICIFTKNKIDNIDLDE